MVQIRKPDTAMARSEPTPPVDGRALPEIGELAQILVTTIRKGPGAATSALDVVEGAARALVRKVVQDALAEPRPVEDRRRLAKALRAKSSGPALGASTAVAFGTRLARRMGPARFAARRTPLWLAVTALPSVYASITRGTEELTLVASHLVHRSRSVGIDPDPERLRRVVVQVVTDRPVRPGEEPTHGPLAWAWARRAVRASLPFASGVATRDPDGVARAASQVDVHALRAVDDAIIDV